MVVMAICVFGWVSYQRLSLNLMPDISYPTLTVRTEYPGTAPEEVETLLARSLEQAVGIVPNLVNMSSISKAGQSDIILEFGWDTDMNETSQDVREKVDRVFLPQGAEKPLLLRYDPSLDPIMRIGFYGPQSLYELRYLAEQEIKRELEALSGVAAVKIKGGLEEEIHVELNERQIAIMGLDIAQINSSLAQNNVNLPGGNLKEGQVEYLIRTLNEFRTIKEIGELVVSRQANADVHLRDIARVYRSHKDREIITRVNGGESIEIEVYKEADANVVAVAERVRSVLYGLPMQQDYVKGLAEEGEGNVEKARSREMPSDESEREEEVQRRRVEAARQAMNHLTMTDFISYRLPSGARLEMLSDQSIFIKNSIDEVQNSALIGGGFAVLVLFVFLRNIVHTLIIGLTIPVSIVATFAPMFIFDVSLNIMSLGGLALGVGMLVDNSIVVLESIFRCREEGDDITRATVRGTSEVGTAVFASTLTTITVFFPIVFVEGVAGQVFSDMALTVVFSLLASLCVALFFIPMLASRKVRSGSEGPLRQFASSDFLRLSSMRRARTALLEDEQAVLERMLNLALALPHLLVETVMRIGLAAAVLVAAVIKAIVLLLFYVLWPLAYIAERWWIKPGQPWAKSVGLWACSTRVGRWVFFERMWPSILAYGGPLQLRESALLFARWVRKTNHFVWRNLKSILWPLVALYLTLRFMLAIVLRLVGIVLHVAIMLIGLVTVVALFLLGLLLLPFFAPSLFLFEKSFSLVQKAYPVLLRAALRNRLVVVVGALGAFVFCWQQLLPGLGQELIPQVRQGEFNLRVALPVGTPLEKTASVVERIETVASDQPAVERMATTVGTDQSASSSSDEGEHTAEITFKLVEESTAETENQLIRQLRKLLADIPEVELEVSYPALFSFKTPVEVEVRGNDLRQLRRLSKDVEARLSSVPGLVDVRSSLQAGNPELQINYRRDRLANYGLRLSNVAELVRNKVQGRVATDFREENRLVDVLVRLREEDRLGLAELERIIVNPGGAIPIPLSAVADIRVGEGPSEIRRIDQQRAALITANIQGVDLGTASGRIYAALRQMEFPTGFDFIISGQNEEMETSLNSLYFALGLAIFLVYVVMASQFESLVHPFVIMFTVPLALIGVLVVLHVMQVALSIVVFIGLIMLAGIVVNNAIVLVDYINTLRRSEMAKVDAIVRAGSVRLRPILMTTFTTVLGLLPMALGLGDGAEIRTPMALTVIAGLISSTFLTLVVIPTVYSLVDGRE